MDGGFFTRVASWSDEGVGVVRRGTVAKGGDISYKGVGLFGWGRGLLLSTSAPNVGAGTPASCLGVGRPHGELGTPVPQGSGGGGGVMARAVEIEDRTNPLSPVSLQAMSQSMQIDDMQKLHHRSGLVTSLAIMYKNNYSDN